MAGEKGESKKESIEQVHSSEPAPTCIYQTEPLLLPGYQPSLWSNQTILMEKAAFPEPRHYAHRTECSVASTELSAGPRALRSTGLFCPEHRDTGGKGRKPKCYVTVHDIRRKCA